MFSLQLRELFCVRLSDGKNGCELKGLQIYGDAVLDEAGTFVRAFHAQQLGVSALRHAHETESEPGTTDDVNEWVWQCIRRPMRGRNRYTVVLAKRLIVLRASPVWIMGVAVVGDGNREGRDAAGGAASTECATARNARTEEHGTDSSSCSY